VLLCRYTNTCVYKMQPLFVCAGAPGSRCSLQFPPIVKICENVLCVDVIIIVCVMWLNAQAIADRVAPRYIAANDTWGVVCVMWLNAQPIADSRLQIHSFEYSQWHLGWHFRKLKAQSSNVSFHRNVAKETLELWALSFRKWHPKWDWLYMYA